MTQTIINLARDFTIRAHKSINQRRKYSGQPYHVHPERVANIVASITDDPAIIAAAWMHDVLEDVAPTNIEFNADAIKNLFGEEVLRLVLEVTDVSKKQDGNRAYRKAIDRAHLAKASANGKTIKLADIIDNVSDIDIQDIHFAVLFRHEAKLLLPHLREGNTTLFARLENLLS